MKLAANPCSSYESCRAKIKFGPGKVASSHSPRMDFSEGIAHEVAVKTINVRHLIDASPSTVSIARELRFCVIVIAVSWASASIVHAVLSSKRPLGP
jgi:hypothetical protein